MGLKVQQDMIRIPSSPYSRDTLQDPYSPDSTSKFLNEDLSNLQFYDEIKLLSLIKSCRKEKNLRKAQSIHADCISKDLIARNVYIPTALITTYAKCGSLEEAQQVFEKLPIRDVVSWNALISGFTQNGLGNEALRCFKQMKDAKICPDVFTYTCILKACGIVGSLEIGEDIYYEVREQRLCQKDVILGTSLVDMYSKCGALDKAREVFESLPVRDIVAWNSMIAGYSQNNHSDEALKCFRKMKDVGLCPNSVTYICALKACGMTRSLGTGEDIGAEVRKQGLLEKNVMLSSALVDMYCKCGALGKARELFDQLPMQDVVSWNALISGHVQHGLGDEALKLFRQMKDAGVCPNSVTFICILKACGIVGSLEVGENIGAEVRKRELFGKDIILNNAMVDMYSKCGALEKAHQVFEELSVRDVVSWNVLIAGYAQNGCGDEAIRCFKKMKDMGFYPDAITYVSILKACGIVGSVEIGEDIYAEVRKEGLLHKDVLLGTAIVDMYSKCGALDKAREVFEKLPVRDIVTWNALIAGYAQNGFGDEVLECFKQMRHAGVCANSVTYICILKACGIVGSLKIGEDIYAEVKMQGLLEKDIMIGNAFVDMYSKCGRLEKAQKVFEELLVRDVVSWNALISGYAHNGLGDEALKCFKRMKDARVCPNSVTYVSILKACSIVGSLDIGEEIEAEVRKQGLLEKDLILSNGLVDMYSKCGMLKKAQEIFEELPLRDIVSWNAIISGYVQNGLGDEALKCFIEMKGAAVCPNVATFVSILKACGIVGSLEIGEDIDANVRKQGLLHKDIFLDTAFVDMYSKCGALNKAKEVFEELHVRDIATWNALIAGYGHLGQANFALDLYIRMKDEAIVPNFITFIVLLNACSHAGLLKEGEKLFDEMCTLYSLPLTVEHYTCMIDIFGRAGCFDKVKALLYKVPDSAHLPLFQSVLGSCRKWKNVKFGKWAFDQIVELDGTCAAAYVLIGNIYATASMQTEADRTEAYSYL